MTDPASPDSRSPALESLREVFEHARLDLELRSEDPTDAAAGIEPVGYDHIGVDVFSAAPAERPPRAWLQMLSEAAMATSMLHARGRVHGVICPPSIAGRPGATTLHVPTRRVDGARALAAMLREGAPPALASYAAPEVAMGQTPSAMSDVFSMAALCFQALSGRPPLGHLAVGLVVGDFGIELTRTLVAALDVDPANRPSMHTLARAMRDAGAGKRATTGGPAVEGGAGWIPPGPAPHASASRSSSPLSLLLWAGGMFVFVGALWLVARSWDDMGAFGRFVVLAGVTSFAGLGAWIAKAAERTQVGHALLVLFSQLLWADAWFLLDALDLDEQGPWTIAALLVWAVNLALCFVSRSNVLAVTTGIAYAVANVAFAVWLEPKGDIALVLLPFFLGAVAALVAALGHAAGGTRLGVPHAGLAALLAVISSIGALILLADKGPTLFSIVWPYAALCLTPLAARALDGAYKAFALVATAALVVVPTLEALARDGDVGFLAAAVVLGALLTFAGTFLHNGASLASDKERATKVSGASLVLISGLVSLLVAPATICWMRCHGRPFVDAPLAYLLLVIGISAGLVALGRLAPMDTKAADRGLLEGAGATLLLAMFTKLSLSATHDFGYPAIVLVGASLLLGIGFAARRKALVGISAVALIGNVWLQYFLKLDDHAPMSLLLIGFGLGLIGLGWMWEKHVKPWWREEDWA